MIASLFALALLITVPGQASRPSTTADSTRIEVRHADRVEYDGNAHTILLTGAVHLVRGSLSIKAERVEVTMTPDEKRVMSAVATVHVEVVDGSRRARAEKAVFADVTSDITLTGSPRLWEGSNEMEADKIIYNMTAKTMKAEGRVRGLFLPTTQASSTRASSGAP